MILKVDDKGYEVIGGKAGVGEESGTRRTESGTHRARNTQTNNYLPVLFLSSFRPTPHFLVPKQIIMILYYINPSLSDPNCTVVR